MSFHFLSSIGHAAGTVVHGDSNPGGGVFGFFKGEATEPINAAKFGVAKATGNQQAAANASQQVVEPMRNLAHAASSVTQGVLGAGLPIGIEAYNRVVAPIAHLPQQTIHPGQFGPIGEALVGKTDIKSPSQVYTETHQTHSAPFSFLMGSLVAAGAYPGGKAEAELATQLVKASTKEEAVKVLVKGGVDENVAKSIAPAVAQTKDPNIIKNIIDKAHTPPPSPADIAAARNPSQPVAEAAGQGTKPNVPEVGGAAKETLHRVDQVGGTPNVESLQNYGPSRGTGGHGTGLYFNLKEQPINGDASKVVRTKIENPMENPFVIKSFDQSGAVNVFGRTLLHHVISPGNATLADVKAAATKAGVKWDENIAKNAAAQTKKELNGSHPGISDKTLANVDQPINHYMKALGHDGIINHGVDDAGGGSVIFRGTKAYDKATAPSVTQPTQGAVRAGETTDEAMNRHLQTISNANSTGPELQDAIKGLKQTHEIRNTEELSKQAQETVQKDYTGSLSKVLTDANPGDKTVAMGEHLIVKAQQEGRIGEAVSIAEHLDNTLREHGKAIQAASIISRLSPEGQLLRATRTIRKVRESNPKNIEKQNKTAEEIKGQLEKPLGQKEVRQTVKQIADEATTGEKLAGKVESAAKPKTPRKVDELVQELTKKVKQEHLESPTRVKRDPLEILKATFGRSEEASKAYPEAQAILREKYANDPKMNEALDKFFGSKLDMPAAKSTVSSAIANQLKTQGDKVSQVIYKSHIEQGNTVRQTAEELVKEGFDEKSAAQLAKEVTKRLDQQLHEAKTKALENLAKDAPERVKSTYLDKLNKLSNLGALDKGDYLHLAQAKLNMPHLTPDSAKKISEMSQRLQGLPEGHEKAALIREIANEVHGSIPMTKGQVLKNIPGLMRTIVASGDLSFGGRQGLAYLTAHPIRFAKAWPQQFTYFKEAFKGGDSEAFDAMQADIKNHEDYHWLEKSGLAILDPHAHLFNQHEEQFIGQELADKIPGVRKLVDGSAYAYTGFANTLRANEFYAQLEHLKAAGVPIEEKTVKNLAKVINNATGRGDLGRFEKVSGPLATGLFAPRLIASRVNMMDPRYYHNLEPAARKEAVRQLLGLSAFGVGILGMAKMAGADVEIDPRSSDFGKIKIGDTRLDVLGGFTQYIRFGAQFALGQKINSTTGAETQVGKGLAGSRLDILLNFFENKAAPGPSFVATELKGKDISGNSIYNPKAQGAQIAQRFIPLFIQDVNDLFSHHDALKGSVPGKVATAGAALFGVGTQTYGQQDLPLSDKQTKYLQQLQESGAPKAELNANKSFFQVLKSAPSRTSAYDRIHKALDENDYHKAQELAQEYNDSVDKHIQDSGWVDKNEQYVSPELEKLYASQKINLTSQSVKAYLNSKEGL